MSTSLTFSVSYSKEKDISNYLHAGWKFSYLKHGRENIQANLLKRFPESFRDSLLQASDEATARKVVEDWLTAKNDEYRHLTDLTVEIMQTVLNREKTSLVQTLEAVYKEKVPFDKVSVFVTTFPINPHNFEERWFMIGRMASVPEMVRIAKHELNHFMFYYYHLDGLIKRGLEKEKREQLKEALAILTNPEGTDKPTVKELEKHIKTLPGKSVSEIIEICLESKWL